MKPAQDKVILLGRISREHGYTKNGITRWKVDLFVPGTQVLRQTERVFITPEVLKEAAQSAPAAKMIEARFAEPAEPLGAVWEHTPSVILSLPETFKLKNGQGVGVLRADFPKLANDFYLCDLVGRTVQDPQSPESNYTIQGFYNASDVTGVESWVMVLKQLSGSNILELPLQPFLHEAENRERFADSEAILFWPGLADWEDLDSDDDEEDLDD